MYVLGTIGDELMNKKVKHNKIRNTGLLYEFLLRQITADVLSNKQKSLSAKIVKEYFNERTELGKELTLYNTLINKYYSSDKKADYFISEILKERKLLNNSQLKREKYNLIKELKNTFNLQRFLSSKVKNYKLHGSVYKLFEHYDNLSAEDKTESYFSIVEHITTKNEEKSSSAMSSTVINDPDLRIISYRILLEKFNNKYSNLNKKQKELLKVYIHNVSNTNSITEHVTNEIPIIKKELKKYRNIIDDKITRIKLNEAIKSMDKFCKAGGAKVVKDSVVVQMMRYYELQKELKKYASKA